MPFAHARESLPDSPPATAIKSATGPAMVIGGALRDDNSAVWSRLVELALRSGDELYVPERGWLSRNPGLLFGGLSAIASLFWAFNR